jgi:PKD domain.
VTVGATIGLAGCLGGGGDDSDDGSDDSGPSPGPDNGTTDDENDGNGTPDNGGAELEAVINWDPENPAVGEEVTFDASGSTGDIAEYRWDLDGDSEIETTGETASRTFDAEQRFSVALIAESVDGEINSSVATFDLREINLSADFVWTPQHLKRARKSRSMRRRLLATLWSIGGISPVMVSLI